MPNALQITDPNSDNPLAQAPSWADAYANVTGSTQNPISDLQTWLAAQRAKSTQMGLWNDQTGLPTGKGLVSAGGQYANALMMGTTAPGDAPGFSLEKVQRRPLAPPNEHIWKIKDPAGADAGTIDTTWNPDTGNLHIEDFQSEGGPNTLGPTAIRQLRDALLGQYPGVQSLSGLRISGATYADRNSGSGPGRFAIQNLPQQVSAAGQYGNALLMGTTAPAPLRAWHGSLEDFDAFDPTKVGSGPMGNRWAKGTQHADEYYLTTNPQHAEKYGPVVQEYQINQPLMQKDAKAELEAWANDQGYDSAQEHLDDYYDGNIYSALDLDNYLKDAVSEAKQKGFPGVHVSLGDLKTTSGNGTRSRIGDFIVLHDPSVATKVGARRDF